MSLESDYELQEMLRDDGVQSFRGREISTGRSLEVHLFIPFGRPENKMLFERLKGLPLESRRRFLDVGTDGSTPYIVTDPLPQVRGFKEWAETLFTSASSSATKPAVSAPAATKPPLRSSEVDESVQILQAGQWRTGTPLPEGLITPPKPMPPEQPHDLTMVFQMPFQPPTENNAGEFTGLFQSPVPSPGLSVTPPATSPMAAPEPEVGEFTKLFNKSLPPSPAPPPPVSPPPEKSSNTGEFTRMFESKTSPAPPPPGSNPLASNSAPAAGPGEFTKFFESPMQPAPLGQSFPDYGAETPLPRTVAPPPTQRGSEFTQVFGESAYTPERPPPPGAPNVPPPPPPPMPGSNVPSSYGAGMAGPSATGAFSGGMQFPAGPPPRASSGPSEYTRMMSTPAMPTLGQPQPAPPPISQPGAPPPATGTKSNTALFIALGVLALLVLLVVIYFVLSHR